MARHLITPSELTGQSKTDFDRACEILREQRKMREADQRPSEDIVREMRDGWDKE